ncbi:MAG: response regulator transcription factor [Alphaproteobacteria bacterium]|nr:response regulator transcription factor [Alphaproteobacteria bacterium]OJV15806.1 MAG: hypothetical protein BGO27_07830 [Alphaproteobacteria bacterium 33-17]
MIIVRNAFQPTIYIIDDKSESLKNIDSIIKQHGFISSYETNIQNAMKYLSTHYPTIIVISEKISGITTGSELCLYTKTLDNLKDTVVVMAKFADSNTEEEQDAKKRPHAYILKDKSDLDFISKIKYQYIVRRSTKPNTELTYGDITMNLDSYVVTRKTKDLKLGPTEFKILQCFLENAESTLSREQIMAYVWGHSDSIEPRTIDVHINRLRSVLKLTKDELPIIETIRSVGYCLRHNTPVNA